VTQPSEREVTKIDERDDMNRKMHDDSYAITKIICDYINK
jgi:hypothetical protein